MADWLTGWAIAACLLALGWLEANVARLSLCFRCGCRCLALIRWSGGAVVWSFGGPLLPVSRWWNADPVPSRQSLRLFKLKAASRLGAFIIGFAILRAS